MKLFTNMWAGCKETTRNRIAPWGVCAHRWPAGEKEWLLELGQGLRGEGPRQELRAGAQASLMWRAKRKLTQQNKGPFPPFLTFSERAEELQSFFCFLPSGQFDLGMVYLHCLH